MNKLTVFGQQEVHQTVGTYDWYASLDRINEERWDNFSAKTATITIARWESHPRRKGTRLPRYGAIVKARIDDQCYQWQIPLLKRLVEGLNSKTIKEKDVDYTINSTKAWNALKELLGAGSIESVRG